jgi:hypothetical protein
MSFRARELSVLAYANGFTLWHYRTDDGLDALLADNEAGYFTPAAELLRPGDQIIVNLPGASGPAVVNLAVAGPGDGAVAVHPLSRAS